LLQFCFQSQLAPLQHGEKQTKLCNEQECVVRRCRLTQ
jgi:hypothetical protein